MGRGRWTRAQTAGAPAAAKHRSIDPDLSLWRQSVKRGIAIKHVSVHAHLLMFGKLLEIKVIFLVELLV